VYGEEKNFTLNIMTGDLNSEKNDIFVSDYVISLHDKLRKAHTCAREQLKVAAERQKQHYNLGVKSKDNYKIGDLVWRNQKQNIVGRKAKMSRHWTGPWVITDIFSEVLFKIQYSQNRSAVIVHGDNIKPYQGNKTIKWFNQKQQTRPTANFPELDNLVADENIEYDENTTVGQFGQLSPHRRDQALKSPKYNSPCSRRAHTLVQGSTTNPGPEAAPSISLDEESSPVHASPSRELHSSVPQGITKTTTRDRRRIIKPKYLEDFETLN